MKINNSKTKNVYLLWCRFNLFFSLHLWITKSALDEILDGGLERSFDDDGSVGVLLILVSKSLVVIFSDGLLVAFLISVKI